MFVYSYWEIRRHSDASHFTENESFVCCYTSRLITGFDKNVTELAVMLKSQVKNLLSSNQELNTMISSAFVVLCVPLSLTQCQ